MTAKTRTLQLETMTRVEGEGGIKLEIRDGRLHDVKMNIYEPPRFFEAFLHDRSFREVPDITARICGICPVAYQMTAVRALETALRVTPGPEIRSLRRLLYFGEWIQSHALHIYLLQAPDFFGTESAVALAETHPELVKRGLRLKKVGNNLMELLGGRSVHPVSLCVGGFYKVPRRKQMLEFREQLLWALDAALETLRFVCTLTLPVFTPQYECVALSHPREYAIIEGHVVSTSGLDIAVAEFEQAFLEEHVAHSTALHSVKADHGTSYFVGPLARVNLNYGMISPTAREVAKQSGIQWPCMNPYAGIVARAMELVHACEESLQIIDAYREPDAAHLEVVPHAADGCAATEAPRGLLYHRYRINEQGLVEFAKIVPPTAQNYRRMEDDLRLLVPTLLQQTDAEILEKCEALVRNYDPCISCSTHAMHFTIERKL